jgi:hypothetical protein
MPDNLGNTGAADDSRVNVNQAHEVRYWTSKWGITEAVLKQAVAAVGVMVKDVEKWLRSNGHIK